MLRVSARVVPILLVTACLSLPDENESGRFRCESNTDCIGGFECVGGYCHEEGLCRPTTCAAEQKNCGTIPDGCGGDLSCGSCELPETCGGASIPNVCGQPPPQNITFTAVTPGDGQVTLVWSNPEEAGYSGVLICWVTGDYRSDPATCGSQATEVAGPATTTVIQNLTNETRYYFTGFARYGASHADGSGGARIFATPSASDLTPPANIIFSSDTPGNGQVALSWSNPPDADYAGVRICWAVGACVTEVAACAASHLDVDAAQTAATITGLTNGATYCFSGFAYDGVPNYASGNTNARRNSTPVDVADITPPGDIVFTGDTPSNGQVELTWTNPADGDYAGVRICWAAGSLPAGPASCGTDHTDVAAPATARVVTGLTNGTSYFFRGFAYDSAPNYAPGEAGAQRAATPTAGDPPPSVLSVVPANGAVGVPVGAAVVITFSEVMSTTAVQAAISVLPSPGTLDFSWSGGDSVVTLSGANPFGFDTTYAVTISGAAQDLGGNPLSAAPYTFSFTTEAPPPAPLYPQAGASWNDYVKNDGSSPFAATDTACAGTETGGYWACLHGGELRRFDSGLAFDCGDLSAEDLLGAFDWVCDDASGTAVFTSTGLKSDKALSDLIDFVAPDWRENQLTVSCVNAGVCAAAEVQTPMARWWQNPVVKEEWGPALDTAGTIYLKTTTSAANYVFGASRVALLIKPGVELTAGSFLDVVSATGKDFLWIEGAIDATDDADGVQLETVRFSVLRRLRVRNSERAGVRMRWLSNSRLFDVQAKHNLDQGFYFSYDSNDNDVERLESVHNIDQGIQFGSSRYNRLSRLKIATNAGTGIYVGSQSHSNQLADLIVTNSHSSGIVVDSSDSNTFVNLVLANNRSHGISLDQANATVIANATIANNGTTTGNGLWAYDTDYAIIYNTAVINAASSCFYILGGPSDNIFFNVAAANCGRQGFELNLTDNNYFTGLLEVVENSMGGCILSGANVNPGLDANCDPQGPLSDFTKDATSIQDGDFVAKVFSDSANPQVGASPTNFNDVTNWTAFANDLRGFGRNGGLFAAADNRGNCEGFVTDCRAWDWSLKTSAIALLDVNPVPDGSSAIERRDLPGLFFLRGATELMGDGVGNDNGLCESNETCLYTPNIGAYQGHQADGGREPLVSAGSLPAGGNVENVTLLRFDTNGR